MASVKVLIVEDEVIIADNIARALEKMEYMVIPPVTNYTDAIAQIELNQPDIAILDIKLAGAKSGIDLAEKIKHEYDFPFIFLTSNTDRLTVEEAKRVEPMAYLAKPFNREELYSSIEIALYNYSKLFKQSLSQDTLSIKDALFIKNGVSWFRLNFNEIEWMKNDHVYVEIFTVSKKYIVRGKLNDFQNLLDDRFFRCHRSYIVNLDFLVELNKNYITVKSNFEVPIARQNYDELLANVNRAK